MTNEIEKKFFDAFGIKPDCLYHFLIDGSGSNEAARTIVFGKKEVLINFITKCGGKGRIIKSLPYYLTITDRILLELIEIIIKRDFGISIEQDADGYGVATENYSGHFEKSLKDSVLDFLITNKAQFYHQVRALFGVKDYAEPKVFTAFCNTESHIQQYECQVIINNIAIDGCLWQEIEYLHNLGIKTKGCCCGFHIDSSESGYIQVIPEQEKDMEKLGYKFFINEAGIKCFYPRTIITKERE